MTRINREMVQIFFSFSAVLCYDQFHLFYCGLFLCHFLLQFNQNCIQL
ncbi:hypothetical protein LINPERHAP2_LOCUS9946 [Linum perenne]